MVPLQIDYRAPSHQNTSAVVGTDLYELVEALASCESIVITASPQVSRSRPFAPRFGEATTQLATWAAAGKIKSQVDIIEGLGRAPEALRRLFTGANLGKQLVKIADAP